MFEITQLRIKGVIVSTKQESYILNSERVFNLNQSFVLIMEITNQEMS